MVSVEIWLVYTAACMAIILSPGPDNLLAIGRGVSQGGIAAIVTSVGASLDLLVHVMAAVFGLALIIQTSPVAFVAIKIVGAVYLIWP